MIAARVENAWTWAERRRPYVRCNQCGHRERDYRLVDGACADESACEARIELARSVGIAPPIDMVTR